MGGITEVRVAGVDGCRGGWAVVVATISVDRTDPTTTPPLRHPTVALLPDLTAMVDAARAGHLAAVAIDMPIALLDHHPRQADVAARADLGPRRSSVFPSPVRATLGAVDYADACARSRAAAGVAPSIQAWNLVPRILELDTLIGPDDQDTVVEAHPELAFARLAGGHPCASAKSTPDGSAERRRRIAGAMPDASVEELLEAGRSVGVPPVDALDAAANATTAARLAVGAARRLGTERDHLGRRSEIVM